MRLSTVYKNFTRRKSAGTGSTAMTNICNQLIADFLQLGQGIFRRGKIVPQRSPDQIIGGPLFLLFLLYRFA